MTHRGPLDEDRPLSPRRLQAMRERYFCPVRLKRCECGACDMHFPVASGRRFHPECPSLRRHKDRERNRAHIAPVPKPNRCELCEEMPHRRAKPRCLVCDRPYAEETLERHPANVGCGLGGL